MIVALSTSSPVVGVALIGKDWCVSASEEAATNASAVCLRLLQDLLAQRGMTLKDAKAFAADIGPGSFIGVRVSATLAKTMAYAAGCPCYVATSFDLIDPRGVVSFPSKKGEWFVRYPGQPVERIAVRPDGAAGFGPGVEDSTFPSPSKFAELIAAGLQPVDPTQVVPQYLIEPSISTPKPIPGVTS